VAGGDRSSADAALIAALASGLTVQDAATQAHVSERTARRRLETVMLERAIGRLVDATTDAADTLRSLLNADSESVRHVAAKTLIESASKGLELLDLVDRVAALEEASAANKDARR
jgi:hypothetical protein